MNSFYNDCITCKSDTKKKHKTPSLNSSRQGIWNVPWVIVLSSILPECVASHASGQKVVSRALLSDYTWHVKPPSVMAQPAGLSSADSWQLFLLLPCGLSKSSTCSGPWFWYAPQLVARHSFLSVTKATNLHSRLTKCSLLLSPGNNS